MPTTLNFKDVIDQPLWRPESLAIGASAAGVSIASDLRNNTTKHPFLYLLRSATTFDVFNPILGDWTPLASPGLTGTFGAGATCLFNPSQGPRGTISSGATTTTITLSTALPAAVAANQLANRGDGLGFRIRIVDNVAASSGKIEERTIVANTAGTAPLITLDSALGFTPSSGATYEFLSGRVYLLSAGVTAAGCWKHYDVATNSFSGNLSITNLPPTLSVDSSAIPLSELYVSNDRVPSSGFVSGNTTYGTVNTFNCIQASAASNTTITATNTPSLFANEYQGFQVRIVEDTVTPTSVGQRRRISSHTSGTTPAFTVPAFTVTPSAAAKFVVENDNDKILLKSSAAASTYTYNINADTWDTTTYAAGPAVVGAGTVLTQNFGITRDVTGNARQSQIFSIRGGTVTNIDVLDIASGATGTWTSTIDYGNRGQTFTTGTCGQLDPVTMGGRYLYLNVNGTQRFVRFDMFDRVMEPWTYLRFAQGTAVVGNKIGMTTFIDGSTKLTIMYHLTNSQSQMLSTMIQR